MRTVILKAFTDEQTGELGYGLPDMPHDDTTNAANDGLLIAHDLIEHVNGPKDIGTIVDELEALGAMWYVRGQHGELRRDRIGSAYTVEQNMAADIVRMYRDYINGVEFISNIIRTFPCNADNSLNTILDHAEEDYIKEFDANGEKEEYYAAKEYWAAFRTQCLHRMRMGYRKAYNRWEKRGYYAANNQFWAIAEAVQPYVKHVEYEGQTIKLTYGDGKAYCEEVYDDA